MRIRSLLRYVPGLTKVAKALARLEGDDAELETANRQLTARVQQLKALLSQVLFANEPALAEGASRSEGEGGPPVPPAVLRFLVAGTEDLDWFLRSGELGAQALVEILARQGRALGQFNRALDFGCGCGRVLRHLKALTGAELHGADPNPLAIRWCQRHLGFARFQVSSLEPPLPYPDGAFDLIYAFSVFTHLTEPLQARWMAELRRVLTPAGSLILTLHGDKCAEWLPPDRRAEYRRGRLVVCDPDVVGTNDCGAFHPHQYVRDVLARGFEVVDFIPEGARGNPPQDAYLLRPRPAEARRPTRAA